MADLLNLIASSGTPGWALGWMGVAAAGLWLWERYECTRTRVLIERQRRARIKRRHRRPSQ